MVNWKRRIAKEWLIFSITFLLTGLLIFLAAYSYERYRVNKDYVYAVKTYNQEFAKWINTRLANWRPDKLAVPEKKTKSKGTGRVIPPLDEFLDFLKKSKVVSQYKIKFPKYKNWSNEQLASLLPKLDYSDLPTKPVKEKVDTAVYLIISIWIGIILYVLVQFVRSIVWSIAKIKKRE